jgi:hypothetical protein
VRAQIGAPIVILEPAVGVVVVAGMSPLSVREDERTRHSVAGVTFPAGATVI